MYKGKIKGVDLSTEELANSIIDGISKLNTNSCTIDSNVLYTTSNIGNIGGRAVICTEDEIINSMSESGNVIGSSVKSVLDRITDKNIYHIVLKTGIEVKCFATDMTNILEMMGTDDLYVVQENNHPGYSTFINKEDVAYFRFPSNAKGMLKPCK